MKYLSKLLIAVFLVSCSSSKKMNSSINDIQKGMTFFDTQGHRGCRGLMPENTIPAMLHAIDLGVLTLEMDISFSKDKKPLLSHEPFFNHEITTKPDGSFIEEKDELRYNLYNMDYEEIIKYDVGMKPHPRFPQQQKIKAVKPLLADVFDAVKEHMVNSKRPNPFFNIETKCLPIGDNNYHPDPAEFVELLMKTIKEKQMERYVIIQSFDPRSLQYLHQHYPAIKTALLIEAKDKNSFRKQIKDLGFTPDIYSPEYILVTPALIENCHEQKMKIIPWTVNDKKEIARLKGLGVDGIISDYPNLFDVRF